MTDSIYREQAYVERCFCDAAATGPCASCGRARCDRHLERALCNRCTQAVTRAHRTQSGGRWLLAGITGGGTAFAGLLLHLPLLALVGLPLAFVTGGALAWHQRRRLIVALGPVMAASKGELPEPTREITEGPSTSDGMPPGVKGF